MPLVIFLIAFGLGSFFGYNTCERSSRIEAVKRGHAAWVVQPDGSTMFVWAGEVQK